VVGIILGLVAVALFAALLRELWRPIAARARAERARRTTQHAIDARVEAALVARGATPERPIEVSSASVVESHASGASCVSCESAMVVEDHSVETHEGEPLRVVALHCRRCGAKRSLYVRIVSKLLH